MDIKVCSFLKKERNRLNLSQKYIADFLDMSVKQVGRWESTVAISADKLALLAELGFDVQYIVTGVYSKNIAEITNKPQRPHFEFEGKLKKIICILENALDERGLELPAEAKGQVVEALLMQSIMRAEQPTKDNIIPFLKVVGF